MKRFLWVILLTCLSLAACAAPAPAPATPTGIVREALTTPGIDPPAGPQITAPPTGQPKATASQLPPTAQSASPPPASDPGCTQTAGQMQLGSLKSELLRDPLAYRVYLPPCYAEQLERSYPVLYLVHGQSYSDDQWDRLGADEAADRLIAAGEIAPFILVMPRDRTWTQPEEDPFGQVVVEELIPYIDSHYRTQADRQHRAVGGLSRGAGWALHFGLSDWEMFGAFGAHSLATFWSDAPQIRTWLNAIPPESLPRIFLDAGDRDRPPILEAAVRFEEILTEKSIPHEWYLFPGYHDEAYWSSHVEKYLRWYTAPWNEEQTGAG